MPYVTTYVEAGDVLPDLSDEALQRELDRRIKKRGGGSERIEPWTQTGLAEDLRAAFYARDTSRFEALLTRLDFGDLPVRWKVAA